jgi:hypothetical protein
MRVVTRRRWLGLTALGGVAAVIVVATFLFARHNGRGRVVVAASRADSATIAGSPQDKTTTMSAEATTIRETTTVGGTGIAARTTNSPFSRRNTSATRPSSPWHVSATTGLTNLAPVTISAIGIASGSYDVGQCPTGQAPNLNTCVLDNVVTVSDGTMNSTVHVFWWLQNGRIDCGSAPGTCVVGVANAVTGATVVNFPIAFDPSRHPTITVTPATSLVDGQSVVVHGVYLGEGTMQIEQCLLPEWASCTGVDVPTQPDGTFTISITVHRQLQWLAHGSYAESSTCDVDGTCVIEAWMTPADLSSYGISINPNQPVALNFARNHHYPINLRGAPRAAC